MLFLVPYSQCEARTAELEGSLKDLTTFIGMQRKIEKGGAGAGGGDILFIDKTKEEKERKWKGKGGRKKK